MKKITEIIDLINSLVLIVRIKRGLTDTEKIIVEQAWDDLNYDDIADICKRDKKYIANLAAKLWKVLNKALKIIDINEEISKSNFQTTILLRKDDIIAGLKQFKKFDSVELYLQANNVTENKQLNKIALRQLKLPEGPLSSESNFYLNRANIESTCFSEIEQKGSLINIRGIKERGKTSLINRISAYCLAKNYNVVNLTLRLFDPEQLSDLDLFLMSLWTNIFDEINDNSGNLSLEETQNQMETYSKLLGKRKGFLNLFERVLLPKIKVGLVLIIDDLDLIFSEAIVAQEVFAILRNLHESAKSDAKKHLAKLKIITAYSTEAYITYDINQSPFNVGLSIDLPELSLEEIKILSQKYFLELNEEQIKELEDLVGGNPFLLQTAFYNLATETVSFNELLKAAHTEEGIYASHLRKRLSELQKNPELLEGIIQLLKQNSSVLLTRKVQFKLAGIGLIKSSGNKAILSSKIYKKYLTDKLIDKNKEEPLRYA
ncbi:MAG: AAA-like domain-containing protein [Prochloraceae cyanobacterium]